MASLADVGTVFTVYKMKMNNDHNKDYEKEL
jgi:hypothetical protein